MKTNKKIMLIYPPGKAYQRGEDRAQCNLEESVVATIHACNDLGYSASILRNNGYDVFLKDYQTEKTSLEDTINQIKNYSPDIIVISTTNGIIISDLLFVREIKKVHSCKIIMKGAIFYNPQEEFLKTLDLSQVDYLVGGEIDTIIGDLVESIFDGDKRIDKIPGILYKKNGMLKRNDFDCWEDNLDNIPFPARDLMNNSLYLRPDTEEPMATIQTSRGCPCGCSYCLTPIISGKRVRKRSVENIFAEIEECYYKYNIHNFFFKADTFTIDNDWAESLCDKIIKSELYGKISFTVNSRSMPLKKSLLEKLKKAGCFMIAVGFESGNNKTLDLIEKGTSRDGNLKAAKMIKKVGIPLFGFFMIGFPWESKKDIKETFKFILKISPNFIELHIAMPYYGTKFYSQCVEYGTINGLGWGSDYFSPNTIGTTTLPLKKIQRMRKRFLLRFYLRPSYLFKNIFKNIFKPKVLKNYCKHGIELLKKSFNK